MRFWDPDTYASLHHTKINDVLMNDVSIAMTWSEPRQVR
jgi:hypothetical protein